MQPINTTNLELVGNIIVLPETVEDLDRNRNEYRERISPRPTKYKRVYISPSDSSPSRDSNSSTGSNSSSDEEITNEGLTDEEITNEGLANEELTNDKKFWQLIGRFKWANLSEGLPNNEAIISQIKHFTRREKCIIADGYTERHKKMMRFLRDSGIFNNADSPMLQNTICSHFVALGCERYNVLLNDLEFAQVLITMNEYQDFTPYACMFGIY